MRKAAALILVVVVVGFVAQVSFAASADAGKATFSAKCAVCHGADGAGKVKGTPDLGSADVQKKSDADLASFVAEGGGKPTHAFAKKGLTDEQIKDVVTYIRTLKK
ncbi:MAG: cytochrome c [Acidobacteria bacterium]|nr:cytochrome c [Acidobacteriaceae bacterium]MBV9610736.1 cytochrome c [Acidobacteriota bacterium]